MEIYPNSLRRNVEFIEYRCKPIILTKTTHREIVI